MGSILCHTTEKMKLLYVASALLVATVSATGPGINREGKLFLVSSTTMVSLSTTTSVLKTSTSCIAVSGNTVTAACTGRKKRMTLNDPISNDAEGITVTKVVRDSEDRSL